MALTYLLLGTPPLKTPLGVFHRHRCSGLLCRGSALHDLFLESKNATRRVEEVPEVPRSEQGTQRQPLVKNTVSASLGFMWMVSTA